MVRNVFTFIPLQKAFTFARPWRRNSSTTTTMQSIQQVSEIAKQASKRARHVRLTEQEIQKLKQIAASINPQQLGIPDTSTKFLQKHQHLFTEYNPIGFIPVKEHHDYTLAVFILPPGSKIPLHDHPHMYVISRVLWGTLKVLGFDIVDSQQHARSNLSVTERHFDVIPRDGVKELTPDHGNIHSFETDQWTAVLDILIPPYDDASGRDCTYYECIDGQDDQNNVIWLKVRCLNTLSAQLMLCTLLHFIELTFYF